ncbi:MAG TPA: hypothetical protein VGP93_15975 [Polyangiaceae bacterium]|jgi:hypothetical protein|nr:hypothetical protein [Polyangiaceae bacterium]
MSKHTHQDKARSSHSEGKRKLHPGHMQELEKAAQTDVGSDDPADAGPPLGDEANADIGFGTTGGTLSGQWQHERARRVDAGMSVDPEDLGRQFLRDATDQDNFESETANQEDGEPAQSGSLATMGEDGLGEARAQDVDLLSNVIREASLFDQPTELGGTRAPRVESDKTEHTPRSSEDREREQAETKQSLRHHRPHAPRR